MHWPLAQVNWNCGLHGGRGVVVDVVVMFAVVVACVVVVVVVACVVVVVVGGCVGGASSKVITTLSNVMNPDAVSAVIKILSNDSISTNLDPSIT